MIDGGLLEREFHKLVNMCYNMTACWFSWHMFKQTKLLLTVEQSLVVSVDRKLS